MPTDLQIAATDYVTAGLHILALTGKKPNGRVHGENWSWDDSFHGKPESLDDATALFDAFSPKMGTTGIAILIPQNYLVADVDSERAAALLVKLGATPDEDTIGSKTKNGLHIWYWAHGADRNRWLGDGEEPDPGRTLLLKGFGGYVVAPPSVHFDANGKEDGTYQWNDNPLADGGKLFMPDTLPPAIAERLTMSDQFAALKPEKMTVTTFTLQPDEGPWYLWPKVWDYQTAGLERAIEEAADGNQNNIIHWAAMTCREEGVTLDVAMERLMAAAEKGGHPRNRARDTILGAYKRAPRA